MSHVEVHVHIGGLSFFCQQHSPGTHTQSVLCLCSVYYCAGLCLGVVWGVTLAVSVGHSCRFMWCLSKAVLGNVMSPCLCISLYMLCLCGHASTWCACRVWLLHVVLRWGLSVRGSGACFTCAHAASGHRGPRSLRPLGPLTPRAPFWVVSFAPSCLTRGVRCRPCPFTLSSDHTLEWHCVPGRLVSG